MSSPIPQTDPRAAYLEQAEAIDAALQRVLDAGRYVLGPEVDAFESEFAAFCDARHAIGVGNGTDAIAIALRALGIGLGDVVVTVAHTATATVSGIRAVGAIPLFVDVDPRHGLLDPSRLETLLCLWRDGKLPDLGGPIRAVVPVHLYGRCADMPAISSLAQAYGLDLIEDCAQAHGARLAGRGVGSWGAFGTYSFYPTKNLAALGDGGAVTTSDAQLADRARELREYGWRHRYVSDSEGVNSRLDEMQAAILRVKLERLNDFNGRRRLLARCYEKHLDGTHVVFPTVPDDESHVFHQFAIRSSERDLLRAELTRHQIATTIHYPVPVHLQPAYREVCQIAPGGLSETERWAKETLSLPMFPQLPPTAIARIADAIRSIRIPHAAGR